MGRKIEKLFIQQNRLKHRFTTYLGKKKKPKVEVLAKKKKIETIKFYAISGLILQLRRLSSTVYSLPKFTPFHTHISNGTCGQH